ncbi:hypothetical protein NN3_24270 [Nocardia neocaledoniensis NBRC 108232]|uniref:hypothetical protein n=1 Tax=Nocardia neocaledoniensis TaxID=236511 RepID=UPI00119001E1|nr:hypothetical protein [Nocardia neocaledoniensis]GEM31420.1 hypothetical protein NN3_24270 [Nocardia neocaledoniensis NBRC 108232]
MDMEVEEMATNDSKAQRDEDFKYLAETFDGFTDDVSITLRTLKKSTNPDARLIPYVKALLDNRTPCKTQIPYRYGEIRWLAAGTLRRIYDAVGIRETIVLRNVPVTQSGDQLDELSWESGNNEVWLHLSFEERFKRLRDMGKLPVRDVVLEWANTDG